MRGYLAQGEKMIRTHDNFLPRAMKTLLLAVILCAAVIYGIHALKQHGMDAQTVRNCMDDPNNILEIWKQPDGRCHNLVKLDGERKVGDMVTEKGADGRTYEITSLIPKCGILCQIEEWLKGKGYQQIWTK